LRLFASVSFKYSENADFIYNLCKLI
jgi:hypothetical protein